MMKRIGILLLVGMLMTPGCFDDLVDAEERRGIPGGLTLACLDGSKYTKLVIEIDHDADRAPSSSTIDMLKSRLSSVCDKPDGISITVSQVDLSGDGSWSADEVRDAGTQNRDSVPLTGKTLTWHILFPAGAYAKDGVLGVAVDASTVAIFQDTIADSTNCIASLCRPSAEEIENSVVIHEVGHLLGLVNLVYKSPFDHEDSENPGHSNNRDSVMYWAVESSRISTIFSGDVPDEFDEDDLADLEMLASGELSATEQLWRP